MRRLKKLVAVRLDQQTYARVRAFAQSHGFNVSGLLRSLLSLAISDRAPRKSECMPEDDIEEMFREFADSMPQPIGRVPVRHHRKSMK